MNTPNQTPFYPVHPGEVLKEELGCRGLSQKDLAQQMGVSYTMLNEILNGKRSVTAMVALLLEASLGLEAQMLVNMQARYNIQMARRDNKLRSRFLKTRNACPA